MSITSNGIALNMGAYYEGLNQKESPLLNCLPFYFSFEYNDKYINFNTINDMNKYSYENKHLLKVGDICIVSENKKGYIWIYDKWVMAGDSQSITKTLYIYGNSSIDNKFIYNLYMITYIKNISSNLYNIVPILNNDYTLISKELSMYCTFNGEYDIGNNTFNDILYINILRALNYLLNDLCSRYNVPNIKFNSFIECTYRSMIKIIDSVSYKFKDIKNEYLNIDISQLINYIASMFTSFRDVFYNKYLGLKTIPVLDPMNYLVLMDNILINKFNFSNNLKNDFLEILQMIDDIIYNFENENKNNYYFELANIIRYFELANKKIFSNKDNIRNFLSILCESIGGIIHNAFMLALMASQSNTSKTELYLSFLIPSKFDNDI